MYTIIRRFGSLASLLVVVMLLSLALPVSAQTNATGWRGEYFNNQSLVGGPALVRTDNSIDFNWGAGSPAASIPADHFSVRWTRDSYFVAGRYRFTTETDDGVRLYIDGNLYIDRWQPMSRTQFAVDIDIPTGVHNVRMEYFEETVNAVARLWWYPVGGTAPTGDWRGEYFNNQTLGGSPTAVRMDNTISFDWGVGSPAAGVHVDNFSVRWTRDSYFSAGTYRFTTETDDGVRLYVDGRLIIDQWHPMTPTRYSATVYLTEGNHNVRMEYFEETGGAMARLWWERTDQPAPGDDTWRGEYFNNRSLSGSPKMVRNDKSIDFNWGDGSPDDDIDANNFSVRWTRTLYFVPGTYEFRVEVDDGVRLYVDDNRIIDEWRSQSAVFKKEIRLSEGLHRIRMEYYDRSGTAKAKLRWTGPCMAAESGNLVTCVPPYPSYSWIKVYRRDPRTGEWLDINPNGYASLNTTGFLKIDGLPVAVSCYGEVGHPYWVEQYIDGTLTRSVGNVDRGEPAFRIKAGEDNFTPWQCPAQ